MLNQYPFLIAQTQGSGIRIPIPVLIVLGVLFLGMLWRLLRGRPAPLTDELETHSSKDAFDDDDPYYEMDRDYQVDVDGDVEDEDDS